MLSERHLFISGKETTLAANAPAGGVERWDGRGIAPPPAALHVTCCYAAPKAGSSRASSPVSPSAASFSGDEADPDLGTGCSFTGIRG